MILHSKGVWVWIGWPGMLGMTLTILVDIWNYNGTYQGMIHLAP
jgi:hypothetical protein